MVSFPTKFVLFHFFIKSETLRNGGILISRSPPLTLLRLNLVNFSFGLSRSNSPCKTRDFSFIFNAWSTLLQFNFHWHWNSCAFVD